MGCLELDWLLSGIGFGTFVALQTFLPSLDNHIIVSNLTVQYCTVHGPAAILLQVWYDARVFTRRASFNPLNILISSELPTRSRQIVESALDWRCIFRSSSGAVGASWMSHNNRYIGGTYSSEIRKKISIGRDGTPETSQRSPDTAAIAVMYHSPWDHWMLKSTIHTVNSRNRMQAPERKAADGESSGAIRSKHQSSLKHLHTSRAAARTLVLSCISPN